MPNCEVKRCPNFKFRRHENNLGVRFHVFPSVGEYRWKWEEWVRTVNESYDFVAERKAYLCSLHFTKDCYMPSMSLRRKVVPSIAPLPAAYDVLEEDSVYDCSSFHKNALSDVSNILPVSEGSQGIAGTTGMFEGCSEEVSDNVDPASQKKDRMAYVGDIKLADLTSPKRAERCLAIIKDDYKRKQDQIHSLKRELRRAKARIAALQSQKVQTAMLNLNTAKVKIVTAKTEHITAQLSKVRDAVCEAVRSGRSHENTLNHELDNVGFEIGEGAKVNGTGASDRKRRCVMLVFKEQDNSSEIGGKS